MKIYTMMCFGICGLGVNSAEAGFFSGGGGAIADGPDGVTTFELDISASGSAAHVVLSIDMFHSWAGDLTITLEHGGTTVTVLDRLGVPETQFGNSQNFDGVYGFDSRDGMSWAPFDNADGSTSDVIPGGFYGVNNTDGTSLDEFVGMDVNGLWTLTISDAVAQDTGGLHGWQLRFIPSPGAAGVFGLGAVMVGRRRRGS